MNSLPDEGSTKWGFRWRQRPEGRRWFVYRYSYANGLMTGMHLASGELWFETKQQARLWAIGRATFERIRYVEYRPPPRPKLEPVTPAARLRQCVHLNDRVATSEMERGKLAHALECVVRSTEACLELVQYEPAGRERLFRAARSRAKVARDIFDEWERSLAIPPPLLKLLD